ncbi:hypothetical protein F5Y09DRAFT_323355 [Xylaria sp. FL1042]|nr:hypothetical protein F5Y09DRAFT_323355 [Xylaria sp. FL1042]
MLCYCANFYGAVNCQNKVTKFGDRCQLCMAMNEGSSAADELHFHSPPKYRMKSFHNSRKIIISSDKRPCIFRISSDESRSRDCAVESSPEESDNNKFSRCGSDYGGR